MLRKPLVFEHFPAVGMRAAAAPVKDTAALADVNKAFNLIAGHSEDELCPNTGNVCSYRSKIVKLYGVGVDPEVEGEMPEGMSNGHNGPKMQARLAETEFVARRVTCPEAAEKCPVGVKIQQGPLRQSFFGRLIKKAINI